MSVGTILVTGIGSKIVTPLSTPKNLDKSRKYEVALVYVTSYNSIPNAEEDKNNSFMFYNGTAWKTINVPTGSYELEDLITRIETLTERSNITSTIDTNRQRPTMRIGSGYQVDMSQSTTRTLFGFNSQVYSMGEHTSESIVE